MRVLVIVVRTLFRFDCCCLSHGVRVAAEGLKDLEEPLELVEDDEIGPHHAEPKTPETLAEVLDRRELRLRAEAVNERIRHRSIACPNKVKQSAHLGNERF